MRFEENYFEIDVYNWKPTLKIKWRSILERHQLRESWRVKLLEGIKAKQKQSSIDKPHSEDKILFSIIAEAFDPKGKWVDSISQDTNIAKIKSRRSPSKDSRSNMQTTTCLLEKRNAKVIENETHRVKSNNQEEQDFSGQNQLKLVESKIKDFIKYCKTNISEPIHQPLTKRYYRTSIKRSRRKETLDELMIGASNHSTLLLEKNVGFGKKTKYI